MESTWPFSACGLLPVLAPPLLRWGFRDPSRSAAVDSAAAW